jgi:hypothetical protein
MEVFTMRRSWMMLTLCAVVVSQAQAGGDKVHTVGQGGLKITGSIDLDDPKVKVTEPNVNVTVDLPAKVHQVKLQAGAKYRMEIKAPDLDPVLVVQDSAGKQLAFDDDGAGGGSLDSKLDFVAPKDATYKIITASLKDAGAFTLTIMQTAGGKTGGIGVGKGMTFQGQVAQGDPTVKVGNREFPAKVHQVKLAAGKKYQIDLVKNDGDIDPLLVVQDKTGKTLAYDDDGGGSLNSRLTFPSPRDDTFKIYAAALSGEGAYTLTVREVALSKDEAKIHEVGEQGLKLNGTLSKDVRTITYQVKMTAGKTYVIDMVSPDQEKLDPFLKLLDPSGKQIAQDDDGGGGLNSRITYEARVTGTHRIIALPLIGAGQFTLEVRVQD